MPRMSCPLFLRGTYSYDLDATSYQDWNRFSIAVLLSFHDSSGRKDVFLDSNELPHCTIEFPSEEAQVFVPKATLETAHGEVQCPKMFSCVNKAHGHHVFDLGRCFKVNSLSALPESRTDVCSLWNGERRYALVQSAHTLDSRAGKWINPRAIRISGPGYRYFRWRRPYPSCSY